MALINIALCESSRTLKETSSADRTRGRDAVSMADRGASRETRKSWGGQAVLLRAGLWCCNLGFSARVSEQRPVCLIDSYCVLLASGLKGNLRGRPEKFEPERIQMGFLVRLIPRPSSRSAADMLLACAPTALSDTSPRLEVL